MSDDPPRMHRDPELDPELRATLEAARADRIEPHRIDRLASRLGPLLAPPGGGGGGAPSAPTKAAATAASAKGVGGPLAAGLALAAALGAAGAVVWSGGVPATGTFASATSTATSSPTSQWHSSSTSRS
ncbi:MAG: hypothetical protein ACK6CU_12570, partial [Deltaproteobacteria bacterium]